MNDGTTTVIQETWLLMNFHMHTILFLSYDIVHMQKLQPKL